MTSFEATQNTLDTQKAQLGPTHGWTLCKSLVLIYFHLRPHSQSVVWSRATETETAQEGCPEEVALGLECIGGGSREEGDMRNLVSS